MLVSNVISKFLKEILLQKEISMSVSNFWDRLDPAETRFLTNLEIRDRRNFEIYVKITKLRNPEHSRLSRRDYITNLEYQDDQKTLIFLMISNFRDLEPSKLTCLISVRKEFVKALYKNSFQSSIELKQAIISYENKKNVCYILFHWNFYVRTFLKNVLEFSMFFSTIKWGFFPSS